MSESPQRFRLKIGMRYWELALVDDYAAMEDSVRCLDAADGPDLLLCPASGVHGAEGQLESLQLKLGDKLHAQGVDELEHVELTKWIAAPLIVVGKTRTVARFVDHIARRQAQAHVPTVKIGDTPHEMPDPTEVPRFPEEGRLDPFGQNPALRNQAARQAGEQIGRLLAHFHANGLAIGLSYPAPGIVDPRQKPWRTVQPLDAGEPQGEKTTAAASPPLDPPEMEGSVNVANDLERLMDVVQRCLLLGSISSQQDPAAASNATGLLESAGYLLFSKEVNVEMLPVNHFFECGALAARIHGGNYRIIDFHPGNIGFRPGEQQGPLGERGMLIDYGAAVSSDHPPTAWERAQDLAVMKLQCNFIQWEAVKLGYRFKAREHAEDVFQLI